MELNPVTIMRPIGTRNGLFWGDCHDESPRKDKRDMPGRTDGTGDTLSGHGSAHFYTGIPPVSPRALRGSLSDRIRMRQTGRRGRCFRCFHRHLSLPPRVAALAPLRGYPMSRNERGKNGRSESDEKGTTKEETYDEENEGRTTERIGRSTTPVRPGTAPPAAVTESEGIF